jgi:HEAT repeat protein
MQTELIARLQAKSEKSILKALEDLRHPDLEMIAKSEPVLVAIRKLIEHEFWAIRSSALLTLALDPGPVEMDLASRTLDEDPHWRVRVFASLLLRTGDPNPKVVPILEEALKDENHEVRASASRCLGRHGSSKNIPALQELYNDSHWEVRWDAAAAAYTLGSEAARVVLRQVLESDEVPQEFLGDLKSWAETYYGVSG